MAQLIVGDSIIDQKLIKKNGQSKKLKHSTYDLTIGQIFLTGETKNKVKFTSDDEIFYLGPRQTIMVISAEEFGLPGSVTGLATLRSTLTRSGLLALNVGIIDPYYNGPISTTLMNFSDRPVPIKIGMSFFRVLFFDHNTTTKGVDESRSYEEYLETLKVSAYRDFPKSFMSLPEFDNHYYGGAAWKMIKGATFRYWPIMSLFWIWFFATLVYTAQSENYRKFILSVLASVKDLLP